MGRPGRPNDHPTQLEPELFQPDTILPAQFRGMVQGRGAVAQRGERALMAAVLEDAATAALGDDVGEQRLALAWFAGHPTCGRFDFETICAHLGLDPDAIRSGIDRYVRNRKRVTHGTIGTGIRSVGSGQRRLRTPIRYDERMQATR